MTLSSSIIPLSPRYTDGTAINHPHKLAYDSIGNINDPAVLLIMGLGSQMTAWPLPLCQAIAKQGFRVIRFDNRDIGLSGKLQGIRPPALYRVILSGLFGLKLETPYTLEDMAQDAINLLDELKIKKAHVIGASMGGMIAQLMAIHHPDRLLSLGAIMSTTSEPHLPRGKISVLWELFKPQPKEQTLDQAVNQLIKLCRKAGGAQYQEDTETMEQRFRLYLQRSFYPEGAARQAAAVAIATSRKQLLRKINLPTLVIHGTEDPLLPHDHGVALAEAIPGARFESIKGMGHDLPLPLVPILAEKILRHLIADSSDSIHVLSARVS